jgi:hypothetical protein
MLPRVVGAVFTGRGAFHCSSRPCRIHVLPSHGWCATRRHLHGPRRASRSVGLFVCPAHGCAVAELIFSLAPLILARALLYNLKAIGCQVRKDRLGDARTLLGRNPIVIQVRVAIALRVFDERCMDGVRDQCFYSVGQCCLPLSVKPTTACRYRPGSASSICKELPHHAPALGGAFVAVTPSPSPRQCTRAAKRCSLTASRITL